MPFLTDEEIDRRIALDSNRSDVLANVNQQQSARPYWMPPIEQREIGSPERTFGGTLKDVGVSLGKGIVGTGQAAIGLADIVTPGQLGKAIEDTGIDLGAAQEYLSEQYTPAQQAAFEKVEQAKGFLPTLGTMVQNPSTIVHSVIESLPAIAGGGLVGRGALALAPRIGGLAAGAIGEGAITAGQTAESIREQADDRTISGKQTLMALGAGAGTGLISGFGSKFTSGIAKKLGIDLADIDTMAATGKLGSGAKKLAEKGKFTDNVAARIIAGGISEGAFEELPQSVQEQVWMNAATGKDLTEGIGEAGAAGLLAGTAMGGGANVFTGGVQTDQTEPGQTLSSEEQKLNQLEIQINQKINETPRDQMDEKFFADLNELYQQQKDLRDQIDPIVPIEFSVPNNLKEITQQINNLEQSGATNAGSVELLNLLQEQRDNLWNQQEASLEEQGLLQARIGYTQQKLIEFKQRQDDLIGQAQRKRQEILNQTFINPLADDEVNRINQYRLAEAQQKNEPEPVPLRSTDLITRNGQPYQRREYLEGLISERSDANDYEIMEVPGGFIGRLTDEALDPRRRKVTQQEEPPAGTEVEQTGEEMGAGEKVAPDERDLIAEIKEHDENIITLEMALEDNLLEQDQLRYAKPLDYEKQARILRTEELRIENEIEQNKADRLEKKTEVALKGFQNTGIVPKFLTSEQVAEFRKANNLPEIQMREDASHPTQIGSKRKKDGGWTGTAATYDKVWNLMPDHIKKGKILDYGAGKNIGSLTLENIREIDSFEPYPEAGFIPTYSDTAQIPSNTYDGIFNNAVLNVVPDDVRNAIVREIGRVLAPNGKAYINVRGKDVLGNPKAKTRPIVIPGGNMEVIANISNAYQKGFKPAELKNYLQEILGDNFIVETPKGKDKFGAVAAIVTKKDLIPQAEVRSNIEPGQGIALPEIQKMYKGQEVFQAENGSISIRLKNGKGITFQNIQDAGNGFIQFAIDTGQMTKDGKILGVTTGTNILLDSEFADNATLWHENKHVLDNLGMITEKDNSLLNKEFNKRRKNNTLNFGLSTHEDPRLAMEENRANMFAQIMVERENYRNTPLGKVIQKIIDFFNKLYGMGQRFVGRDFQTLSEFANEIESGRIYERPSVELEAPTEMPQFKEAGNINSEEFKKWFGKSAAKTKEGIPVPFYHGSPNEFTVFEDRPAASTQKTAAGLGHFFTMDKDYASGYAKGSGNVIEAYLKMEKPYKMTLDESDKFTTVQQAIDRKNDLKAQGYDSIILQIPGAMPIITVFDSNQIKSTANRGTWSQTDPDIRFQAAGNTNSKEFKNWFKGSKVIDENRDPLIVYQGRSKKGLTILQNPTGDIWATDVKESAENFANIQERYYPNRPKDQQVEREMLGEIHELYMNLKNPKTINHKLTLWNPTKEAEQINLAKQEGYDGLIIQHDNGKKDFVAFDPTQIKSISNRGTWNPSNPDIRFEVREQDYSDLSKPEQKISDAVYRDIYEQQSSLVEKLNQNIKKTGREINRGMNKYLGMISTNLKKINPILESKVRKLGFDTTQAIKKDLEAAKPLLDALERMSPQDKSDWHWARVNGDSGRINQITEKYDLTKDYQNVRESLNRIRRDGEAVGYNIGFIDEYWPRILKDRTGFLQATRELSNEPVFSRALKAAADKQGVTVDQLDDGLKADIISNIILGRPSGLGGPVNIRQRYFEEVPPEFAKFYMDSDAALMSYIYAMNKKIEARKFFGKVPERIARIKKDKRTKETRLANLTKLESDLVADGQDTTTVKEQIQSLKGDIQIAQNELDKYATQDDFKENIGSYVMDLMIKEKLEPGTGVKENDEQALKDILTARFNEKGTTGLANVYKNLAYIDTMGSPISAITQLGDLAWAVYVGGLTPKGIVNSVRNIGKAIFGKSNITREDIGITRIAQEFADGDTLSNAVSKIFKIVGIEKLDRIGKEALINNAFDNYQARAERAAKDAKEMERFKAELKPMFGNKSEKVINTLLDPKTAMQSYDVKLLVYSRLLDFQPADLSETPEAYLNAGNGRLFYMLKMFTLKQFDVFRREVWHNIKTGERDKVIQGLGNMTRLLAVLSLANAGADELKDLVLGKETKFEDHVIENLLTLGGASRYLRMQTTKEGIGSGLAGQILPPFKFIDAISKDVMNDTRDGLRSVDSIPVAGKLYYWHFGRGKDNRLSIEEQDFKKETKNISKFKKDFNDSDDKRLFLQANFDMFKQMKFYDNMTKAIRGNKATIDKLKDIEQTPNVRRRLSQLEQQRKDLINRYFEMKNNL